MKLRKAQKLRNMLMLAGLVMVLLGYYSDALAIIGLIVAVSGLIPHFRYNKCPHCGRQLGLNEEKFCQFCGKPLD